MYDGQDSHFCLPGCNTVISGVEGNRTGEWHHSLGRDKRLLWKQVVNVRDNEEMKNVLLLISPETLTEQDLYVQSRLTWACYIFLFAYECFLCSDQILQDLHAFMVLL